MKLDLALLKKYRYRLIALLAILFITSFVLHKIYSHHKKSHKPEFDETAALVEVAQVKTANLPKTAEGVGSLVAKQAVNISSEVDGRVIKIYFKDGQYVAKDMPLIQLDDAKAKADLDSAQAALDLSKKTLVRYQALFKLGGLSRQDLDQKYSDLESKEAAVKTSLVALQQKTIKAPFDGMLGAFQTTEGAYIRAGESLVSLVNKRQLRVEYAVSEIYLPQLKVGQSVLVSVESYPGQTFAGTVTFISPSIDKLARTIAVQAIIPNEQGILSPGMFVHVSQLIEEKKGVLAIPEQAVMSSLEGYNVFRVVDNKAVQSQVTIGDRYNGLVEIKTGLALGENIVIAGQQKLEDGSDVKIIPSKTNDSGQGNKA